MLTIPIVQQFALNSNCQISNIQSIEVGIAFASGSTKMEVHMHNTLEQKVAYLEFVNDQLISEIHYVDRLLKLIGFPEGLETIKSAAQEVIEEQSEE